VQKNGRPGSCGKEVASSKGAKGGCAWGKSAKKNETIGVEGQTSNTCQKHSNGNVLPGTGCGGMFQKLGEKMEPKSEALTKEIMGIPNSHEGGRPERQVSAKRAVH